MSGQVVDALTGRAVADVAITPVLAADVRPGGSFANSQAILSDAQGRFVLRGLAAGAYQIAARRAGYVEGFYGAIEARGEGKSIVLAEAGRIGDLKIHLWKLAAIGGTVVDDAGEPIIRLQVRAFKRNLIAGHWKFGEYYSDIKYGATTDDRGMYRVSDLEPGEYIVTVPLTTAVASATAVAELEALRADPSARAAYLAATESINSSSRSSATNQLPQYGAGSSRIIGVGDALQTLLAPGLAPTPGSNGSWLMYQTHFHPGVTLPGSAVPIAVNAGEERTGIDFGLKPVRSWRVSGTVTGLPSPEPISLHLVRADDAAMLDDTEVSATLSSADGAFSFAGVPVGHYSIRVIRIPQLPRVQTQIGSVTRSEQAAGVSQAPTLWASVPVTVGAGDVNGVIVALSTGTRANGRVLFAGSGPQPTPAQIATVEITIEAANGRHPLIFNSDRVRLTTDVFQTRELVPGKYLIRTYSQTGWKMKSAMAGDQDIADVPLLVDGRDIPPITISFTDRPLASLRGTLRGVGSSAATAFVSVFPTSRDGWIDYGNSPRRLRRVQPDDAGVYDISDLPRGDYFVVALSDDRAADWREPSHLAALSRIATRVTIADEEAKVLNLEIQRLPRTSDARLLRIGTFVARERTADPESAELLSAGPFVAEAEIAQEPPPRAYQLRPAPAATGTGSITGIALADDASATPVRRVVVTLNATDPKIGRTTVTDDAGRFAFGSLPAAGYSLTATKPGYLDVRFGATKPGRAGTPLMLANGEKTDVVLRMLRGSVITGTIRDAQGEPARGVRVSLSRYQLASGERRLTAAGFQSQPTDDRGQYRIFDLEPGEYFVSIERAALGYYRSLRQTTAEELAAAERELRTGRSAPVAPLTPSRLPEVGYAPVFYPGTSFLSQAIPVAVGAGEEKAGIDIAIRLVAFASIEARVIGPDGQPPATVQARLIPQVALPGLSIAGLESGMIRPVTDGLVRIGSVPPGEYTLHVGGSTVASPPMAASSGAIGFSGGAIGLPMWALLPLTIDGRDTEGLTIQLEVGKRMTGRVIFDGVTPPPASVGLSLVGPQMGGTAISRRGSANPEFSIDGIIPSAYRLVVGAVRGWTLKSVSINGRDAADLPVELNADTSDVVVTLTDRLTELSGVLQTAAGTPAANYFIIVFAKDPVYWSSGSRRIVSLRPSTDGRFVTPATAPLPPGEYLIAAVTDVSNGEWFDPEFLKSLAAAAISVTLAEGERKRQDLKIK